MRSWIVIAVTMAALLVGGDALAARSHGANKRQTLDREARKACLSGDYAKGVAILAELFVETNDPVYLYNQGRCLQENVRYQEAVERFREYLSEARKLSAGDRANAERHIADCEAAAQRKGAAGSVAKPPTVVAAPPTPHAAAPETVARPDVHAPTAKAPAIGSPARDAAPAASTPSPPASAPSPPAPAATVSSPALALSSTKSPTNAGSHPWQHVAKWIATGAAVAFLGVGIYEHLNYLKKNHDYNDDPKCDFVDQPQCKSLADSADKAQVVAIVGYGAAAVATGLAITFFATDSPRPAARPEGGLSLRCMPNLAGIACQGRF
jgi:hypothetical protein